eukprot:SAG31_NODE_34066_length_337_cov_0.609244_1_plen_112_part_11
MRIDESTAAQLQAQNCALADADLQFEEQRTAIANAVARAATSFAAAVAALAVQELAGAGLDAFQAGVATAKTELTERVKEAQLGRDKQRQQLEEVHAAAQQEHKRMCAEQAE